MFVFVSGIQAAVRGLKHGLRPAGIGIRQSAAPWHRPYAQMGELARFRKIESVISRNVSNFLMTA